MTEIVLNAEIRKTGKSASNRLRMMGKVPGIYYAPGDEPLPIAVKESELKNLIYTTEAHIVKLKLGDGKEFKCVLKEVEFDPVTDKPIHFDLYGLKAGAKITLEVPIVLVGKAPGVEKGGIIEHLLHTVEVECLSDAIPEHIEVDISNLDIGDSIHVRDLNVPGVKILENELAVVVAVVPPRGIELEAEAEAKPAEEAQPSAPSKPESE
ncbi:large subunit ribosomal protein L25 [Candidatus Kryptonium thompsonii]|uniref:Large ribosomal subunit protein bL25 n=1 Tax=Candidatus Kryptonium thompsonii TaxID=1633631 RepID=A0A0N7MTT7_9BACT|nr:50S ribosomal protein L25 [Candidatus Kryptonium thompsoni]CUS76345.1 large subunit ribosomal protein L25 [Candidatus Kryptonium thompsoni]CUS78240.1 large subunit ribosomal protein L25 [Candidatus Kryptonium thompsoni]CUS80493.1 large subunit ribosomal protein L25 [Candidatus Kryptonium thompsoni]CUS81943.1 large subunit ribosomal protein L25 [Candidatus Kryptonium thompsoni]CUS91155.1 large subunit ribosomal protein L25 [Candidatus Kryptonium thompsoni]